jgi:spore maturation protein CgeD
MFPKASIIITSYNQPVYLKQCIDSCLSQTYENIEVIVADDNSSKKEVWNLIHSYSDPRLISFNSNIKESDRLKTARYATQINTAVRSYSTGKYIFYLPDDDFFYKDKVKMQVEHAEKNGYDVVYAAQDFIDTDGNVAGNRYDGTGETSGRVLDDGHGILDHGQVMTSRSAFDAVCGWDDSPATWGGADAYFWTRLSRAGYKFYPLPFICLSAKRFRINSVQWNISQNLSPNNGFSI